MFTEDQVHFALELKKGLKEISRIHGDIEAGTPSEQKNRICKLVAELVEKKYKNPFFDPKDSIKDGAQKITGHAKTLVKIKSSLEKMQLDVPLEKRSNYAKGVIDSCFKDYPFSLAYEFWALSRFNLIEPYDFTLIFHSLFVDARDKNSKRIMGMVDEQLEEGNKESKKINQGFLLKTIEEMYLGVDDDVNDLIVFELLSFLGVSPHKFAPSKELIRFANMLDIDSPEPLMKMIEDNEGVLEFFLGEDSPVKGEGFSKSIDKINNDFSTKWEVGKERLVRVEFVRCHKESVETVKAPVYAIHYDVISEDTSGKESSVNRTQFVVWRDGILEWAGASQSYKVLASLFAKNTPELDAGYLEKKMNEMDKEFIQSLINLLTAIVQFMSTTCSGLDESALNPGKRATKFSSRIKDRKSPYIHVGYRDMPQDVRRYLNDLDSGESRGSVRPHFRRGHFKSQPHGPKNSLRKQILVDPVIVGLKNLEA